MIKNIKESKIVIPAFIILLFSYFIIFQGFFPNSQGRLGHDYYYFFSRLIAGFYWFKTNGLTALPYFTPALCAGNVFYTDPQNLYFSLPQFLTFAMNPLDAVRITFFTFAATGLIGTYLLMRKVFLCGVYASLLAAAFFLFNGFYAYRIIIGHLTYHGFMLIPLISFFLLWNKKATNIRFISDIAYSLLSALLFSYILYSGGVHIIIPGILTIIAGALIYGIYGEADNLKPLILRAFLFLLFTFSFSFSKISACLHTITNLPRSGYPIAVFEFKDALIVLFKSLFFKAVEWEEIEALISNTSIPLSRHEFEFGVTPLVLILIIIGAVNFFFKYKKNNNLKENDNRKLYAIILVFIFLIPLCLNTYIPGLYDLFKTIPIIKNSVTLVRWYSFYILPVILLGVIGADRLKISNKLKFCSAFIFISIIIIANGVSDKSYYHNQNFIPSRALRVYDYAAQNNYIPPIKHASDQIRTKHNTLKGDDILIGFGVSNIECYEALFGYKHEFFPQKNKLYPASIYALKEGYFNMTNPACYTFPNANSCKPGDNFTVYQHKELRNFASYKPFKFKLPIIQKIANKISFISLSWAILFLMYFAGELILTGYKKKGNARERSENKSLN